ncbi:host cell division inhibitor Icd-like protein [Raoultella ornithinolytica]|uniref:host cell division inhibitor Icd-like protein n=1 Tax=Raoultella ornithinolytica TaxID=54291 RepID=UPI001F3C8D72|nr:host cell division inhibitor Icd-like protein [Raoultella ornithinolytica]
MKIEKSRFSSEATPQPNVNTGVINGNDFSAIVPVIAGRIGGREANIASARALHKALGVGRDFTNWIKGRIDQYGFIAGTDFIRVENLSTPRRASAKTRQQIEHDYLLSLDMAKEVAMVERNEQGRAHRSDHQQENQCYSPHVAAKSATGRGNPSKQEATQTPKASFFVSDHYAHLISGLARTKSMVALVGLRSRRPVSFCAGISTPANVTAISERGNSGGDSLKQKEAAYMLATTPTQKPSFIWIIAAVRRDMPTITAKIHHIVAETEQEARRSLARDHVCFFAGRIRTGGAHA